METLKAERNVVSKEIGRMKDAAEREAKVAAMRVVGDKIAALDKEVSEVETGLNSLTATLPNIPAPRTGISVPRLVSSTSNAAPS